jgi:hypothetical protein
MRVPVRRLNRNSPGQNRYDAELLPHAFRNHFSAQPAIQTVLLFLLEPFLLPLSICSKYQIKH